MDPRLRLITAALVFTLLCACSVEAACVSGCKTCDASTCRECLTGYYLDNNNCLSCGQMCGTCDKNGCLACMPSYYMTLMKQCAVCGVGCATCNAINDCTTCIAGFSLSQTPASTNGTASATCSATVATNNNSTPTWLIVLIAIPMILVMICMVCLCGVRGASDTMNLCACCFDLMKLCG